MPAGTPHPLRRRAAQNVCAYRRDASERVWAHVQEVVRADLLQVLAVRAYHFGALPFLVGGLVAP